MPRFTAQRLSLLCWAVAVSAPAHAVADNASLFAGEVAPPAPAVPVESLGAVMPSPVGSASGGASRTSSGDGGPNILSTSNGGYVARPMIAHDPLPLAPATVAATRGTATRSSVAALIAAALLARPSVDPATATARVKVTASSAAVRDGASFVSDAAELASSRGPESRHHPRGAPPLTLEVEGLSTAAAGAQVLASSPNIRTAKAAVDSGGQSGRGDQGDDEEEEDEDNEGEGSEDEEEGARAERTFGVGPFAARRKEGEVWDDRRRREDKLSRKRFDGLSVTLPARLQCCCVQGESKQFDQTPRAGLEGSMADGWSCLAASVAH